MAPFDGVHDVSPLQTDRSVLALPPRLRRYPSPQIRIQANTRLSATTFFNGTPCWLWQGRCNNRHYGTIAVRMPGFKTPRTVFVHRYSIHVFHGIALPDIDFGMHLCNVPQCACPQHLRAGTQSENEKYKQASGGHTFDARGRPNPTDAPLIDRSTPAFADEYAPQPAGSIYGWA